MAVMPWDAKYVPEEDTVVLVHSGPLSLQAGKEQAQVIIALLKETKAPRLLLDYSDALGDVPAADLAALPHYYSELETPPDRRIALIVPRSQPTIDSFLNYSMICSSKGYDIRLFGNREGAQHWLQNVFPTPEAPG
jgi:hypothetical protein